MRVIGAFLLLVILCGCNRQQTAEQCLSEMFGPPEHLIGRELTTPTDSIGDPYIMAIHNSQIYFVDMNTPYNLTVLDIGNNSVSRAIHRGRGPGEMLWITDISVNDSVFIAYDNTLKTIYKYRLSENGTVAPNNVELIDLGAKDNYPLRAIGLSDESFVATGVTSNLKQFLAYDSTGVLLSTFDEYPENPKYTGPQESIPYGYQGNSVSALNERGFAWGAFHGFMFKFFRKNGGAFVKSQDFICEHPLFEGRHGDFGTGAMFMPGNRAGTVAAKSSESKYYFLYSGKIIDEGSTYVDAISGDNILVFDHNGKPLKHILLDRRVRRFDVDRDDSRLLCYAIDAESGNPALFEYDLN